MLHNYTYNGFWQLTWFCYILLPFLHLSTQNISPLDDLAFDMYQDPEVAQIIRKLEKKKQEAALRKLSVANY